ncbi:AtzE family amidohydrolase [Lichenihabitans sp. PAMC28606]|uniref:AtzE family amidohydrolase n=1 Tax=Lichenihabitans sp. PAMC28606 TaxID=2880932 RepID=UPI001D0B7DBC|nr:AtzE family amidohydrolase [Lichenihabitans sp. PAMC28606]UDL95980.1 AtzE family amidohydrolase [Lichenihabitans sp. PAMC28606]
MRHFFEQDAATLARAVASGEVSAREIVEASLARIALIDPNIGAFTTVTADRALARASAVDDARRNGSELGPLAGVPFAVKNLFDLEGIVTRAGSLINRDDAPATRDATLVRRLEQAGAICVGALNMGEYAYDFTGENIHDGPSRNPHDLSRMSGGSSGGSASAVAAGLVPLALGSDTNGSIRVPASLCGLFGLKPTYGRLSRAGTFPFVTSFDHVGPMARSVADLALAYDAMQGADPDDPVCAERPSEPVRGALSKGADGLRIAVAGGFFAQGGEPEAFAAVARCAAALNVTGTVELPEAHRARAAAYLISASEGGALHLERLRTRAGDFDPATRDRLLAGAMLPAAWIMEAQRFRRWFADQLACVFETTDILLAPATPCRAPSLGQTMMTVGGQVMGVRANLGLYTQPISFIGLPVVTVPIWTEGETLPIGVQIIGAPWREDHVLRVAASLQAMGAALSPVATL